MTDDLNGALPRPIARYHATLGDAIAAAQSLAPELYHGKNSNTEYTRAQAELIVDTFGLDMDVHRDVIIKLINPDGINSPE